MFWRHLQEKQDSPTAGFAQRTTEITENLLRWRSTLTLEVTIKQVFGRNEKKSWGEKKCHRNISKHWFSSGSSTTTVGTWLPCRVPPDQNRPTLFGFNAMHREKSIFGGGSWYKKFEKRPRVGVYTKKNEWLVPLYMHDLTFYYFGVSDTLLPNTQTQRALPLWLHKRVQRWQWPAFFCLDSRHIDLHLPVFLGLLPLWDALKRNVLSSDKTCWSQLSKLRRVMFLSPSLSLFLVLTGQIFRDKPELLSLWMFLFCCCCSESGKVGERLTVSPQLWCHPCLFMHTFLRYWQNIESLFSHKSNHNKIPWQSNQTLSGLVTWLSKVYHFKNIGWDSPRGPCARS